MNQIQYTTNTAQNAITTSQNTINNELFQNWIDYLDAKPKTVESYTRSIRQFIFFLQKNSIKQPQRSDIITYREMLAADHKPATVTAYLMAVKQFFNWTEINNLYPNIARQVKAPKIDKAHKKDALTQGQVKRLLKTVETTTLKGKRDFAILSLMATTGLRVIEVERANIEDLRTVGGFTALFIQGKGRDEKSEFVKIAEPVEKAINAYLRARNKETGKQTPDAPLFASTAHRNTGERMTTRSISRLVKDNMKAADLDSDRLTAHSLRHTTATLNLLNGATLEETQQLLRHTNINTTMIYTHALERANNQSENRIAAAIFG